MATKSALAALDHIWTTLAPLGRPMALMGGISLAAWNYIRATRDVDLLIAVERSAFEPVVDALLAHQCRAKHSPPIIDVGAHHFAQFLYTPTDEFYEIQIDLLLAESDLQKSAVSRRVRRDIPGVSNSIDVLHCDDLILFKLVAGRLLDRADAAMLLRENRDAIDVDYLCAWVEKLDLRAEFGDAWSEAFPGEDLPPGVSS